MNQRDLMAYGLIGLGALALLARLTGGAGWLWVAVIATALLVGYARRRAYGLLVVGAILAGTAVGLVAQEMFPRWDGVFLIALAAGVIAIDVVERRLPRWPRSLGLGLAAAGVVLSLLTSGVLGSIWFALLLMLVGGLLLWRRREANAFPPPRVDRPTGGDVGAPTPGRAPAGAPVPIGREGSPVPHGGAASNLDGDRATPESGANPSTLDEETTEPRPTTG